MSGGYRTATEDIEHGTDRGYRAHLRRDERACFDCTEAHRLEVQAWRERTGRSRQLKPCGTTAAYKRHLKAKEPPCWRCRLAKRHGREFVEGPDQSGQEEAAA